MYFQTGKANLYKGKNYSVTTECVNKLTDTKRFIRVSKILPVPFYWHTFDWDSVRSMYDDLEINPACLHSVMNPWTERLWKAVHMNTTCIMMNFSGQHWPALGVLNHGLLFLTGSHRKAIVQHNITQGLTRSRRCILNIISIYRKSCYLTVIFMYSTYYRNL